MRLEPGERKNDRPRTIGCSPELVAILRAQRAKAERKWSSEPLADRPVFLRPKGRPVGTFDKARERACEAANVAGRIFHDLRRTAARDMVRRGVPERVAMKRTGHETRDGLRPRNIGDEQDDPHVAELLTGRLDVAVAVATGESKSTTERTTGRKPALRLVKARS